MHHSDEIPENDYAGPSRSQERRDALAVLELAKRLVSLSDAQLAHLPLDADLRAEVLTARKVTQQIARKRAVQYLAKQMRKREDAELDTLRASLEHDRGLARRETAELHRLETWRERLIEEGDDALSELLAAHPHADRQQLRQLARQARVERHENRPPHAFRELFRLLREVFDEQAPE